MTDLFIWGLKRYFFSQVSVSYKVIKETKKLISLSYWLLIIYFIIFVSL